MLANYSTHPRQSLFSNFLGYLAGALDPFADLFEEANKKKVLIAQKNRHCLGSFLQAHLIPAGAEEWILVKLRRELLTCWSGWASILDNNLIRVSKRMTPLLFQRNVVENR